jgi:hypothetical protein
MDAQVNSNIVEDLSRVNLDPTIIPGVKEIKEETLTKKFPDKFSEMDLIEGPSGVYSYEDRFGKVQYKKLQSIEQEQIPFLGIFAQSATALGSQFIGIVSEFYQFVGHDIINLKIKEMVEQAGTPLLEEHIHLSNNIAEMLNEIVIRNIKTIERVGDVCPQLIVTNSYNGHKAVTVAFGFSVTSGSERVGSSLRNKLGVIRQVHLVSSKSKLVSTVSEFVQIFNDNIVNTIESNFNTPVAEPDFLYVLDMIEQIGKKKRNDISTYISQNYPSQLNTWNLFNVICKFSTIEKHINTRILLENIAEKVLILPVEFSEMMRKISQV